MLRNGSATCRSFAQIKAPLARLLAIKMRRHARGTNDDEEEVLFQRTLPAMSIHHNHCVIAARARTHEKSTRQIFASAIISINGASARVFFALSVCSIDSIEWANKREQKSKRAKAHERRKRKRNCNQLAARFDAPPPPPRRPRATHPKAINLRARVG